MTADMPTDPKALDALAPEGWCPGDEMHDAHPAIPMSDTRPECGDAQRRCWTVGVFSNGNAQCWLYSGHPGDCQFAAPVPTATLDALRKVRAEMQTKCGWLGDTVKISGERAWAFPERLFDRLDVALAALPAEQPATPETEREWRTCSECGHSVLPRNVNGHVCCPSCKTRFGAATPETER